MTMRRCNGEVYLVAVRLVAAEAMSSRTKSSQTRWTPTCGCVSTTTVVSFGLTSRSIGSNTSEAPDVPNDLRPTVR